jgi:hypothetical protein
MKPTTKEVGGQDRRKAERREPPTERRVETARAVTGDRRVVEKRGIGEAMVDALEDILEWERQSERTLRVAAPAPIEHRPN